MGKGLEPGTIPSAGDTKGMKGDAVASSLGPSPLIGLFRAVPDSEPDCICSSSESPSTNSDSSFPVDTVSASVNSSTKPCAWAWEALMPLMTAGKVRPSLFDSTKLLEKICCFCVLNSRGEFAGIREILMVVTDL